MAETDLWLMSAVIFVPSLFALVVLFVPKGREEHMRWWTLGGTVVTLVLSIMLFIDYYAQVHQFWGENGRHRALLESRGDDAIIRSGTLEPNPGRDMVARIPWLSRFNIDYYLGVDGISMALVLLTTVVSLLAMLASWNITKAVKGYCILFLILETGMLGTFLALDLFLFYIFWEVMLLPMYFLIGIWGGPRREYAAIKFFLYTLLGSVFILIAFLAFYFTDLSPMVDYYKQLAKPGNSYDRDFKVMNTVKQQHIAANGGKDAPINSFDMLLFHKVGRESARIEGRYDAAMDEIAHGDKSGQEHLAQVQEDINHRYLLFPRGFQITMFVLLFIGFAIKVPIFPFHTWLPDAHVEAPTPISMILAGILLKMGGYGIIRIAYPICPYAAYSLALVVGAFGMINIVYGAFAAMAQTDFKKLVAYSSVSHMGYVILGIAVWTSFDKYQFWSWGMNGAMFQMIAHGITSAGMFFLVGVIYDRVHHRDLNALGGINNTMPVYSSISAVIFFGAMGLPGLCGFIGEFFTILGAWNYSMAFSIFAALTVVITAAYILWTVQRVYLGQVTPQYREPLSQEINLRELLCIVPLVVLAVLLGVWPNFVLDWMEPSVTGLVENLAKIIPTMRS